MRGQEFLFGDNAVLVRVEHLEHHHRRIPALPSTRMGD
jgi:hypothetical protein